MDPDSDPDPVCSERFHPTPDPDLVNIKPDPKPLAQAMIGILALSPFFSGENQIIYFTLSLILFLRHSPHEHHKNDAWTREMKEDKNLWMDEEPDTR